MRCGFTAAPPSRYPRTWQAAARVDPINSDKDGLELLLARWVLARLPPEAVPALAIDALQGGCASASVAIWAGLGRPTQAEIEAELPSLLKELRMTRPTQLQALKRLVDDCATAIVAGRLEPLAGAALIWDLWRSGFDRDAYPETWLDLGPLVGAASAGAGLSQARAPSAAEVTERARALIARGGLNIGARIGPGQLDGREVIGCRVQEHVLDGLRTTVRLALEFADGLAVTFAAAPDGASLQLGFREVRAYDLGEHGSVELRSEGFPCEVMADGTRIRTVRPLCDGSGRTVALRFDAESGPVYVYPQDENIALASSLPASLATSLQAR